MPPYLKYLDSLSTEGSRGVKEAAKLARELGYKDPFQQLQYDNGACVGDLLTMLEDNPGLIEAMYRWIEENFEEELEELYDLSDEDQDDDYLQNEYDETP